MSDSPHEKAENARSTAHSVTDKTVNAAEGATEEVKAQAQVGTDKARSLFVAVRDSKEAKQVRDALPYIAFGATVVTRPALAVGIAAEQVASVVGRKIKERNRHE